ncbi:protein 4.1 homolog [Danaus plexippus]|uniref:protein 4.1 homolog n=1 Tax=Danaus plexippus TaxID=13037 RepID=UPI002AB12C96|nr:protein 4.1 homolog [Danaus plexippus]
MRESLRRLASDDIPPRGRVRVELLTGEHITIDLDRKALGGDLLDLVCESLDVIEKDYFGLLHAQGEPRVWVHLGRRLSKTFKNEPWDVRFAVKFYPLEPSALRDDMTRYQLSLALRRDLMEGRLTCSTITYALLASYVLQAEAGDRSAAAPLGAGATAALVTSHRAVPLHVLNEDMEMRVDELYRKHKGQTPAEAELNYLENAKKLALYGAEMHSVKDSDDVELSLAVCGRGIAVVRDGTIMNRFPWTKILKLSYNKRLFVIRLRAADSDECETDVSFRLNSSRASERLWTSTVEHHVFFRRESPVKVERVSGFPMLGARRLSCRRTLRQMRDTTVARQVI